MEISDDVIERGMESIIITGLCENAHLTGITADKAHLIIKPILNSLKNPSTINTVKEFLNRSEKK